MPVAPVIHTTGGMWGKSSRQPPDQERQRQEIRHPCQAADAQPLVVCGSVRVDCGGEVNHAASRAAGEKSRALTLSLVARSILMTASSRGVRRPDFQS